MKIPYMCNWVGKKKQNHNAEQYMQNDPIYVKK
jgi:hypothetical protein